VIGKGAPLACALVIAVGCSSGEGSEGTTAATDPLPEAAFQQPWLWIDRVATGKRIDAVARGPAGFVAITHQDTNDGKANPTKNNIAAWSPDGVSWGETAIVPDGHYRSIAFGAGIFVAVGSRYGSASPGMAIISADGRSWTVAHESAPDSLWEVRFTASEGFVAVGSQGSLVSSTDGRSWVDHSDRRFGALTDAALRKDAFVAVGHTALISSSDGRSWQPVSSAGGAPFFRIVHGNGVFLAVGGAGPIASTDGRRWSVAASGASDLMAFAHGTFLALRRTSPDTVVDLSFEVSTSADGNSWSARTTARPGRSDLTCASRRCIVLPGGILLLP